MKMNLAQITTQRKTGHEDFLHKGKSAPMNLLKFWQWSGSDLLNNADRGKLAEFIVASALGVSDTIRQFWDSYDLETKEGIKVEVKSSAYIQSWYQKSLSKINFDIKPTVAWNPKTNEYGSKARRQADVYVFCVLAHKEKATINPLDLDQWDFYILPTAILDETVGIQKMIALSRIVKLGTVKVGYEDIEANI